MSLWAQLIGGGVLLYFGAQWLVAGSSALALALRIPQLIVGLTVVAYGTSTPETIVSVKAAIEGHPAIALGNVFGSNVANIGLILGTAALIAPAKVDGSLRTRELPVLIASTGILIAMLADGAIQRLEGAALLACGAFYTGLMIRAARSASSQAAARSDAVLARAAADVAGAPKTFGALRSALVALFGLAVLLVGVELFVSGTISAARALGVSEQLIGLTVVAIGTSLPELVTSIVAATRQHSDLAVGNVVGSNIFNIFVCLGAAGLTGAIEAPLGAFGFELVALASMTVVAGVLIRTDRVISRQEGGLAVALYAAFIAVSVVRG